MGAVRFMGVTARTAGFNTIDYAKASDSSNFLTILMMMVGGSPGSTAGGMKTTTFALIGLLAWSRLRAQRTVTFGDRSIPEETIQRAVGLSMGITQDLSVASRWLLVILMFVGRIGPLSLAAALVVRLSLRGKFRLAYEDVNVG